MLERYDDKLPQFGRQILGAAEYALTMLMSRSNLSWNWKLQPEQRLSVELADALRIEAKDGRLKAVFCHVANEGKRSKIVASILKAMGLIPGSPDFWFIWNGGGGLIELKRPDKPLPKLEDNQEYFMQWAQSLSVRHAVHNSVQDALQTLRQWGALSCPS